MKSLAASHVVVLIVLTGILLVGMNGLTVAGEQARSASGAQVPLASLLSAPDSYEGRQVLVQGKVIKVTRATFPNGRRYYSLLVGNGRSSVTVFSWDRPNVKPGDSVRVEGVFHVWRYNLHHMIESDRTTALDKDLVPFDSAR